MQARMAKRHRAERRFRRAGFIAILSAVIALAILLVSVLANGLGAFRSSEIRLDVAFSQDAFGSLAGLGEEERDAAIARADYGALVRDALRARFPDVEGRRAVRALQALASVGARSDLRSMVRADPSRIGRSASLWLPADDEVARFRAGEISKHVPESERRLSDRQIGWIEALEADGDLRSAFNTRFLVSGDSREPELAGVWGAAVGSFWTLAITLVLSFPVGAAAALYLEEFAPKSRWTDWIEININNLAAVPSIVFGLLGLALFLNFLGLPRSAPLVGGMVLALMTLPTVIIAGRAAIRSVPPSIREAALAVGASPLQVALQHVLPLALPGVLTGTIIGMARALGETAPLLMIGMVAFIVDIPAGVTDPATVLPVQIFLWADAPERAFLAKTSAAILVLLGFLVSMNLSAVLLRNRFERRW
ncbi:MAG: phosphate ABC transporter permease PstA [Myxococcota bacterium]